MTVPDPVLSYDAADLDLASGLAFVLDVLLSDVEPDEVLAVSSRNPALRHELPGWCRIAGHELVGSDPDGDRTVHRIRRGPHGVLMWQDRPDWGMAAPRRQGRFDTRDWLVGRAGEIPARASAATGFAPRGAVVEPGVPPYPYRLTDRDQVWAANVSVLYEQATASQWDASDDPPWPALQRLPDHLERAVCQVMTNLAENEYSALYVPASWLPRIHPHFTEVVMFLATQVADEARHIEAFTKRALANGGGLQYSSASTQASLRSLLDQEDFSQASFLLSVLGEGTFLDYLAFVESHAPDPVTADIARRARIDESRHVAFGLEHARHYIGANPEGAEVLRKCVAERSTYLAETAGSNPHVEEALVVLAAGGVKAERIREGVRAVRDMKDRMHRGRVARLHALGFARREAEDLSEMHTPNFM